MENWAENGKGLRPHPSNLMLRVIKGPVKLRASTNYLHAVCARYGLINIRLCCASVKERE